MEDSKAVPKSEQMRNALAHYERAGTALNEWRSDIPQAIKQFYSDEGPTLDPEYEYEILVTDSKGIFEQGTWLPIGADRIIRPDNINKYIQHGILRKINR
jgi:hypothetical protein